MDKTLLRRVQLTQLEIAREIKRVCEENDIRFFLLGGTYLGAVRHQGFIPWDDDMDLGMLRGEYEKFCRIAPEKLGPDYCLQTWYTEPAVRHQGFIPWDDDMDLGMLRGEYEKFCRIAPEKLGPDYCLQTWYTEPNYGLPFGKVMKRGTVYLESKKSRRLQENGIYVDIFPFDSVPQDLQQRQKLAKHLLRLYRLRLMKCGYKPWMEEDKVLWHKRLGYLFYQFQALFCGKQALAQGALAQAAGVFVLSVPGAVLRQAGPGPGLRCPGRGPAGYGHRQRAERHGKPAVCSQGVVRGFGKLHL